MTTTNHRFTTWDRTELTHRTCFEKLSMEMDPWGIFSVSLARRRAS